MSAEAHALAAEPVSEHDYEAFHAVLAATVRGRAFLDEHARRNRHADTQMLLAALKRLENQVAAKAPPPMPVGPVPAAISSVLDTVRSARAEIDAVRLAGAVTHLVSALDAVQRKLAPLLAGLPAVAPEPEPPRDLPPVKQPFALAITAVAAQALAKREPDDEPMRVFKAGEIPPPPPFAGDDFASGNAEDEDEADDVDDAEIAQDDPPAPLAPAGDEDPIAPVMALSEDERLALFT